MFSDGELLLAHILYIAKKKNNFLKAYLDCIVKLLLQSISLTSLPLFLNILILLNCYFDDIKKGMLLNSTVFLLFIWSFIFIVGPINSVYAYVSVESPTVQTAMNLETD